MVAWEARADAEGRERGEGAFWDGIEAWAAEQRPWRRDVPH